MVFRFLPFAAPKMYVNVRTYAMRRDAFDVDVDKGDAYFSAYFDHKGMYSWILVWIELKGGRAIDVGLNHFDFIQHHQENHFWQIHLHTQDSVLHLSF